ncbi:hypothetical protein [uncultured Muribaculum sp.]|uniref:hypothetical protein n=1 Tax=uncultured Muribaculum sp. TaxID=1918613 RepID=UPI00321F7A11
MAERRMFTKKVTNDDEFISLPSSAQALYFHLNQEADDDGFNKQVQTALFKAHASIDDLKILMLKNFVIRFESGVIVIRHWRMHNTLRKDRYTPTNFQDELQLLGLKESGEYVLGCQTVAERLPQVKSEEVREDKVRLDKGRLEEDAPQSVAASNTRFKKPTLEEITAYCTERKNNVDPQAFFDFYESVGWRVGNKPMKDWKACVRTWERREQTSGSGKSTAGKANGDKYKRED